MEYSDELPCPPIYSLWTAIHAVGAAAERRIWTEFGQNVLHPNLFLFLVGPPGTGKSQAINPMASMLRKSAATALAPNDLSKQGLLDSLGAASKGAVINGQPFDYHFLAISVSEMSNFMSKYDLDMAGILTDLFDCPPMNEEKKRTHDKGKPIAFPGLSFIMGTATQNLGNTITNEMWGSGFMARVIMIFSADDHMIEDIFRKVPVKDAIGDRITENLTALGKLVGPMTWTPDARLALNHFKKNQKDGAPLHNRLTFYVTRRWLHLAKLCMIAALSELSMTVEERHFQMALGWLKEAESLMPEIFKDLNTHQDGQIFEEFRTAMYTLYMRTGIAGPLRPLHVSILYDWLSKRTAAHNVGRMIEIACAADHFRRLAGTSGDDALYIPQVPTGPKPEGTI